jgi:hypothetical protein
MTSPQKHPVATSPPRDTMTIATERVQLIIDAAEKAGAGIIEDTETHARRYLEESRRRAKAMAAERAKAISELTDSLLAQAETVKRQSDDLISALDGAKGEIAVEVEPPVKLAAGGGPLPRPPIAPYGAMRVSRLSGPHEPEQSPEAEPRRSPFRLHSVPEVTRLRDAPAASDEALPETEGPMPAGAKLLATQMSVAGSSREEIEDRLRSDYGIDEAASMLDSVLDRGA